MKKPYCGSAAKNDMLDKPKSTPTNTNNNTEERQSSRENLEIAVKMIHGELRIFGPRTLQIAIKLGKTLAAIKAQIKHDEWADYANQTLKISPGAARDYMLLAKHEEKLQSLEFKCLGIVEALNHLRGKRKSPPTEKFRFVLADGRKLPWKDGVITRESVQVIIDRRATASPEKAIRKLAAQKQEHVIRIASAVNQVCLSSTREQFQLTCDALRTMELLLPWDKTRDCMEKDPVDGVWPSSNSTTEQGNCFP